MGLIAQNVQKVFPEAVTANPEGFLSVSYPNLVAPMIGAIKELLKASNKHSREIASMKAENAQLKANDRAKNRKIKELELELKQQGAEAKARLDKIERTLNPK